MHCNDAIKLWWNNIEAFNYSNEKQIRAGGVEGEKYEINYRVSCTRSETGAVNNDNNISFPDR